MSDLNSDPGKRLVEALLKAWAAAPPEPDLEALLVAEPGIDQASLARFIEIDAVARWERNLPATLRHYQAVLPQAVLPGTEAARRLLLTELLNLPDRYRSDIAEQLKQEYGPTYAADIDAAMKDRQERLRHQLDVKVSDTSEVTRNPGASKDPDRTRELGPTSAPGNKTKSPDEFLAAVQMPKQIGFYRIIRLLGEGGMGAVYEAEQPSPKRVVALKVIRAGVLSASLLRRFEREAEVLGRLHHPGIAQVYEAGQAETPQGRQPYFVMEMIRGQPLTQYAGGKQLTVPQRLELLIKICDAVQYAHQQGVIHRDLKPGNILVDETGQPKILDFGIAKVTGSDIQAATMQTDIGQLVGTLPYMSPEQAAGDPMALDTRSDVYALGVIAYELMAGRLPYELKRMMLAEAVRVIQEEEPTRLSVYDRRLRGDLETIVGKALEKDKTRRYQSASEFAADIRRHLTDEPITARPPSVGYQVGKFARRNKVLVAGVLGVLVALVLGVVGTTTGMVQARRQRAEADRQRAEAVSQRSLAQDRATKLAAEVEAHRRTIYFQRIQLADSLYRDASISVMEQTLAQCPKELRNWEWHRLRYLQDRSVLTVSGSRPLWSVAWSPDGRKIATGSERGRIGVVDAEMGKILVILEGHKEPILRLAFSADSTMLASASNDGTLRLWDVVGGKEIHQIAPARRVEHAAFNPEQTLVHFSTSNPYLLGTMDVLSGVKNLLPISSNSFNVLAWTPDCRRVLIAERTKLSLLDTVSGVAWWSINADYGKKMAAFSPDGKRFVLPLGDGSMSVRDTATGAETLVIRKHDAEVHNAQFSPDGRRIASGSGDRTVRVWDAQTGEELAKLRGHMGGIGSVAWSPDGRRLASVGDHSLKVWDPARAYDTPILAADQFEFTRVTCTPDGQSIVTLGTTGALWVLNATRGDLRTQFAIGTAYPAMAVFPDSKRLLSFTREGVLRLWDIESAKAIWTTPDAVVVLPDQRFNPAIAISPDGRHAYTTGVNKDIHLWNMQTGRREATFTAEFAGVHVVALAVNPEGDLLAVSSVGPVGVLDARSGAQLWVASEPRPQAPICGLAFSPDGKTLAAGGRDGQTILSDARTGRVLRRLAESNVKFADNNIAMIECIAWSPDGTRLVTGGYDNQLKIWDTATGALALTLLGHKDKISTVTFTPDGKKIISGSADYTVRLWDSGFWEDDIVASPDKPTEAIPRSTATQP